MSRMHRQVGPWVCFNALTELWGLFLLVTVIVTYLYIAEFLVNREFRSWW